MRTRNAIIAIIILSVYFFLFATLGYPTPANDVILKKSNQWLWELQILPYNFGYKWEESSRTHSDCKTRSMTLYRKMKECGATNVKLVIGYRTYGYISHAWVEWNGYIFDTTSFNVAIKDPKHRYYVPIYILDNKKYKSY